MRGPDNQTRVSSRRRADEQDGAGGAREGFRADVADASGQARALGFDPGEGRIVLDAHVAHADRAVWRPSRLEILGRISGGRLDAERIVDVDRLAVARRRMAVA